MRTAVTLASVLSSAALTLGWNSGSPRCEVCSSYTSYIHDYSTLTRTLNVPGFTSYSGNWEMYLKVNLAHNYLWDLTMSLNQFGGNDVWVWYRECGSNRDLSAIFYDSAGSTVSNQGKCGWSRYSTVYARPYQRFSTAKIGNDAAGTYTFKLRDNSGGNNGWLYSVCLGFFDEVGCVLSDSVDTHANSSTCEICTEERTQFPQRGQVEYTFNVTEFESESNDTDFFVNVELDQNYLGGLQMTLKDEDSGQKVSVWNNECSYYDDLNVTFSDAYDLTVAGQNRCGASLSTHLNARPYQSFGSIGESQLGLYTFQLKETYNYLSGTVNRVCVGWLAEEGCTVSGGLVSPGLGSSSPRCEICDNEYEFFPGKSSLTRHFNVTAFESLSDQSAFYVSVQLDHNYLAGVRMTLKEEDSGEQMFLWYNECSYFDDLNVTFSDLFNQTVSEQGRCGYYMWNPVFAEAYESFNGIGESPLGEYTFTLRDTAGIPGTLRRVCVGWYDLEGCSVSGTVESPTKVNFDELPRCEVCDNEQRYFGRGGSVERIFTITDFNSESGDSDFYVSVEVDQNYLSALDMTIKSQKTGREVYLWNNECSYWDDLNVTFSDRFNYTVAGQNQCQVGLDVSVYAKPWQQLGNMGDDPIGKYTFSLWETYNGYPGFVNQICVGWFDAQGCTVSGSVDSFRTRPFCEICDNDRTYFPVRGSVSRRFTITDFNSDSGNSDFFVRVQVDHNYLGALDMFIEDEDLEMTRYLWNNECTTSSDLNVTFSDVFNDTVTQQGRCNAPISSALYARPWQSLGEIGETPIGKYEFTLQETWNRLAGFLDSVCVGWFDDEGCTVEGTVTESGISSNSPRCQICNDERVFFPALGSVNRTFTVTDFQSESNVSAFYVAVQVDYNYLGSLEMLFSDEHSGVERFLWNNECGTADDLNVTFSDAFPTTVASQGRCSFNMYSPLYARPWQLFGDVGENNKTGEYNFTLRETYNLYGGYLNRVCVGWLDEAGCSVSGVIGTIESSEESSEEVLESESPTCQICSNERVYFEAGGSFSHQFTVTDFVSQSGENEFFVSIDVDHNYLDSLDMILEESDTGDEVFLWNNECGTSNDLNVTFSDLFSETVASQSRCDEPISSRLYAKPYQSFGDIGTSPLGTYTFTLRERYNILDGHVNNVCIGWFDLEGCSVSETTVTPVRPQRCEICDSERKYLQSQGSIETYFNVDSFQSDSERNSFFVSVNVEHRNLGTLQMAVWDTNEDGNTFGTSFMYGDCAGFSDLNATFSNIFDDSIEEQGKCSAGLNTEVFAVPNHRFGKNVGNDTRGKFSVELWDSEESTQGGHLNKVCIGWFTSSKDDNCEISGSVLTEVGESDEDDSSEEDGQSDDDGSQGEESGETGKSNSSSNNGNGEKQTMLIVIILLCSLFVCFACIALGWFYHTKNESDNKPRMMRIPSVAEPKANSMDGAAEGNSAASQQGTQLGRAGVEGATVTGSVMEAAAAFDEDFNGDIPVMDTQVSNGEVIITAASL